MWRPRLASCPAALLLVASFIVTDAATSSTAGAVTVVPRPDHVVIVIDENHPQSIVGDPEAPYITQLAAQNASFTQSFAITHPSQPNYLALFSGSTQGVTTDNCPQTFSTPNLGSSLIASGATFAGYSEDLPSTGYTGCQSANYARKHNPWVNWPAVPASASLPFTAFPTDFSTLPNVSIVVPNLQHDMHDGSVAMGDAWLQNNMDSYITWAKAHNSLFILTFDEDDNVSGNLVPTIFAGQRVTPGNYAETINHYNVLRTVEDAYGLAPIGASSTASPVLDVWTPDQGNTAPTAAFSSSCTQLACSFDGSASTDQGGTISSYAWTFGDNATGTGQTTTHTYGASATYTVTLTVTDNLGQSAAISKQVVASGPPPPLASDSFNRTVASGLGNADVGGAWTVAAPGASLSVSPGGASLRLNTKGTNNTASLKSVSSTDTDLLSVFSYDKAPNGNGVYFSAIGRSIVENTDYRAQALMTGTSVILTLAKTVSNVATTLVAKTVSGLVVTPGQSLSLRVQVTGTNPTTIRSRIWPTASSEPTTWTVSTTDSTSVLQAAGWLGYNLYLTGSSTSAPVTVTLTNVLARPTATAPANQLPVASFTTSCTLMNCSVDAGASTDPDGTIASYAWQFGDTTTGTGKTSSRTYGAAGSYTITLTVTDNSGGSSSTTRSVTATAPANQLPVASFTTSCTLLTCSVNAGASTDPDGTIASYAWQFGDTTTGTGVTSSHTYSAANTYPITLTLTDNSGGSSSTTRSVTVNGPANQLPVASFTTSCTLLTCSVDAGASTDPDGSVVSYAWQFGDGTTDTGVTSSHTYGTANPYTVTLSVTDNSGGSSSTTHTVTPTAPANQLPIASFTTSCTLLTCSLDAGASTDPDGSVVSYAWQFGDTTTGTGVTANHTYGTANTYTITLTVTDNSGGTTSTTRAVTTTAPANQLPIASFTTSCTLLTCSLDAGASTDPDGTIASYAWQFGDTTTGSGVTSSHTYSTANTYTITLTVTDNSGGTTSTTRAVTTTAPANQLPIASFTTACTLLTCSVDAGASTDPDGTIASYAWQFGDTTTGTGVTSSHTYSTANTYTITLTVTDNSGGTTSTTRAVTTTAPANQLPIASFTTSCTLLTCSVDAGASTDPDGTIASYAWQFGDTTTGSGKTSSRTYAAAGTYTITLTVTDNSGGSSSTTRSVTATAPVIQPFASDAFGRTVANGWGNATVGGAWTVTGTASNFSVSPAVGSMLFPSAGQTRTAYLLANARTDADVVVAMNVSNVGTGSGLTAAVVGRLVSSGNDYRATARFNPGGTITLSLTRVVAGVGTFLGGTGITVPGLTYGAGTSISVRVQVTGTSPTTVRARAWLTGSAEPTTWAISATDSTAALQVAGGVGLVGYLSSNVTNAPTTWRITSFIAKPTS